MARAHRLRQHKLLAQGGFGEEVQPMVRTWSAGRLVRGRAVLLAAVLAGSVAAPAYAYEPDPAGAPALRLVLNLPAYRIDVYEFGELTRSYPVAIGLPRYRTPRGTYRLSSAEWNPWWHPPDSPWARGQAPSPPGPRNPMGQVKLYFRDLYYIHGTPEVNSIGSAASHGCVRMLNDDVVELARLVHRYASPELSPLELDAIASPAGRTRRVPFRQPVVLEIRYDLVESRDGILHVHRDIYDLGSQRAVREQVMQVLRGEGHESGLVDMAGLEDLLRGARRGSVSMPIAWLVPDRSAPGAKLP